jgi:threonylcarbamoyladenosine tRNA methylthiotransferase CDKAL1
MKMRVFLKSYGCSANQADGEVMKGCLAQAGVELVDSASAADVVVVNTCAVKGPTENRVIDALKRLQDKKLVVAGCLPLTSYDRLCREVRFDGVVGPAAGAEIVGVVERVFRGETVTALRGALVAKPDVGLPQLRSNPVISVVPVSYGCLGSCAYCCVVFARGRLRSYTVEEVLGRVRRDLAAGAREFWVTSQDMACYGRDLGVDLAVLLEALGGLEGDFRVRVGMMTPNLAAGIADRLVAAFRSEKVFKFVHLPVQSGDDGVLRRMRRFYTAEEFKALVGVFRAAFPEVTVATDVICGFPGETAEAFEKTLRLIGEVEPDIVNVSKFFARPKTAAAEMRGEFVDLAEIKRRSTAAAELAKRVALERNMRWVGWTGEVLVDEVGKVAGTWVGRNFAYKPVAVRSAEDLLGRTLRVRVVGAFATHLSGVRL